MRTRLSSHHKNEWNEFLVKDQKQEKKKAEDAENKAEEDETENMGVPIFHLNPISPAFGKYITITEWLDQFQFLEFHAATRVALCQNETVLITYECEYYQNLINSWNIGSMA